MTGAVSSQTLYTLQTWFSPSFPVGAYTYSHGLENAFENGLIVDVKSAVLWIGEIVQNGNGFADAVFLTEAHQAVLSGDAKRLAGIAEFAAAFAGTAELRLESEAQGAAFIEVVQNVEVNSGLRQLTDCWQGPYPYSVAVGAAAAGLSMGRKTVVAAFLHGLVSNLSSALVRIIPLGQTDGQRIIATLAKAVGQTTQKAIATRFEDVTTSTLMVDLSSMQHESQYTRLFRS